VITRTRRGPRRLALAARARYRPHDRPHSDKRGSPHSQSVQYLVQVKSETGEEVDRTSTPNRESIWRSNDDGCL